MTVALHSCLLADDDVKGSLLQSYRCISSFFSCLYLHLLHGSQTPRGQAVALTHPGPAPSPTTVVKLGGHSPLDGFFFLVFIFN